MIIVAIQWVSEMHVVWNGEPVCYTATGELELYPYRIIKSEPGHVVPDAEMYLMVKPGQSKKRTVEYLKRLVAWLEHGDQVRRAYQDCFYCEIDPIPRMELIEGGEVKIVKRYSARYPWRARRKLI